MKLTGVITAIAVAFALLSSPGHADSLIRLTDRDDLFGWEAVGRVDMEDDGYCTGTLVASNLVLTAAHCMFDHTGQMRAPSTLQFRAGLSNGTAIAARTVGRFVVADGYNPNVGMSADNVRTDAALLELTEPIPTAVAGPFVPYQDPSPGDRLSVVSYGQSRDRAPSWQRECRVLWRHKGLVSFDCNVTFGSSGAPVFTDGAYRAQIVSLVVGGSKNPDGTTTAYGMHLPPVLDALKRKLRSAPPATVASDGHKRVRVGQGGNASGAKFAKP